MRKIVLAVACLLMIGCTTTKVNSVDLRKTKLLVLALGSVPESRIQFEDTLVRKLERGDIVAIPSHPLLPNLSGVTREAVIRIANDNAVTSVVVVAAVAVSESNELVPLGPPVADSGGQLAAFIDASIGQGHIREGNAVFMTRIYQLSTGDLIWGGVSWAISLEDLDAVIDETTSVISSNIITAHRQLRRLNARGIDPAGR